MFRLTRKNLIYFFLLITVLVLVFAGAGVFHSLQFGVIKTVSVPIRVLSFPLNEIKKLLYYHRTFDEYKRLKEQTDVLKARLVGLEEVIRENTRLEDLLKFKRRLVYSSVVANVIGRNPSYWNSTMVIDRGENDGIQPGMPVVNAAGVVGKIAEVGSDTSKVVLLTDPQFSVAALVQGPRESGLVSGTLKGICHMRYVRERAEVNIGDQVITSKLSSSFPEGLLIGEIEAVKDGKENPTLEYFIKPSVEFSQIEEVLVILKENP